MKKVIVYPVVLFITMAFGFRVTNFFEKIPRTWDEEKINSLHLPLADPAIHIKAVSEDYYTGSRSG